MSDLQKIVDELSKLTVLQAAELSKMLEEHWGVSASAPVVTSAAPAVAATVEEKTDFDVVLLSCGDNKINVIKVVREITALGLKEAKDLVDSAPQNVKTALPKSEAQDIKSKLEAAGAKVELK